MHCVPAEHNSVTPSDVDFTDNEKEKAVPQGTVFGTVLINAEKFGAVPHLLISRYYKVFNKTV